MEDFQDEFFPLSEEFMNLGKVRKGLLKQWAGLNVAILKSVTACYETL